MDAQPIIIAIPSIVNRDILERIQNEFGSKITVAGAEYVFDLSKVDNVYSALLTLLTHMYKQVQGIGGTACIVNVTDNVRQVLENLKIYTFLPIHNTMFDYEFSKAGGK